MISFDALRWRYDPYPIAGVSHPFTDDDYRQACEGFPPVSWFKQLGSKYSLSTINHPEKYAEWVKGMAFWSAFNRYVTHGTFMRDAFGALEAAGTSPWRKNDHYSARWEFSLMNAAGGSLAPHTDLASKVVTLVIALPDGWDDAWGGGTDILRPRDPFLRLKDYHAGKDAFELVDTLPHHAHTGVLFVKTLNSWHSVGPLTGPDDAWRRTLTINIERAG